MKPVFLSTVIIASLLSSGCATEKFKQTEVAAEKIGSQADSYLEAPRLPWKTSNVFVEDRSWVPVKAVKIQDEKRWEAGKVSIAINNTYRTFSEFTGLISSKTGVGFELAPEVIEFDEQLVGQGSATSTAASVATSTLSTQMGADQSRLLKVNHQGTLSSLLDAVTGQKGFYWKVLENGKVYIYKYASQTWRISALKGNLSQTDSIDNGQSNASIEVQNLSIWQAFEDGVKSYLSEKGKVVVSEALGTISVTDTPTILQRVDEYIKLQNDSLAKTVLVNLSVYNVRFDESENYGTDWNLLYETLSTSGAGLTASLVNTTTAPTDVTNLTLGIIGSNSEWNGSKALIKALSKRGKVSQLTTKKQLTFNGQPVPFKAGKSKAYLKSSQTTISNGVATTTSEQGVVESGLFLNVVPHVLDDGKELLLQFSLNVSTLDALDTVTSGNSTIQTPETSSHEMIQRVRMSSGDTLVITGFDSKDLRSTLGGMGSPDNSWFGGSSDSSDGRSMLVVLVQPIVGG